MVQAGLRTRNEDSTQSSASRERLPEGMNQPWRWEYREGVHEESYGIGLLSNMCRTDRMCHRSVQNQPVVIDSKPVTFLIRNILFRSKANFNIRKKLTWLRRSADSHYRKR